MALEEAPRFRSAYELLDEIVQEQQQTEKENSNSASVSTPNLEGIPF